MVSEAIAKGDVNAVNYFVAQGYTEALKTIGKSENNKVIMMPLETTGLMDLLLVLQNFCRVKIKVNNDD